jgi:hypothetical protein
MAFRTNYRFERAERDRIKKDKKEEKLRRQQERAALHPAPNSSGNLEENTPPDESAKPRELDGERLILGLWASQNWTASGSPSLDNLMPPT